MDSGLPAIMAGCHRTFWSAAATLPRYRPEPVALDVTTGSTMSYLSRRRFGFGDR